MSKVEILVSAFCRTSLGPELEMTGRAVTGDAVLGEICGQPSSKEVEKLISRSWIRFSTEQYALRFILFEVKGGNFTSKRISLMKDFSVDQDTVFEVFIEFINLGVGVLRLLHNVMEHLNCELMEK
jgi:hypothetical protein